MLYYSLCMSAQKNQFGKCLGYTRRFVDWFLNMRGKNLQKLSQGTEVLKGTLFLTLFQPRWLYACKSQFWNSPLASSTCLTYHSSTNPSYILWPTQPPPKDSCLAITGLVTSVGNSNRSKRLLLPQYLAGGLCWNQCLQSKPCHKDWGANPTHISIPRGAIIKPLS